MAQREDDFPVQPQRYAAHGEHLEAGRAAQQVAYEPGAFVDEILEPVQDEQELTSGEVIEEDVARGPAGLVGDAERLDQGVGHQFRVAEGGELGEPDTVAVPILQRGSAMGREPGFAHAARSRRR
ncbi:hypothetical protein QFZ67_006536 [Streptomyces sp. V1I1]|nr:hypothetical protein [Streptomyces sp. V1I1]MDQ0944831.1 hypothetical protein [Streptomyces sp. V1I1]